jgi:hypothetical protein
MITPGTQDIYIYRANDFSFSFDITINSVVLDLTGATAYAQIREGKNEEDPLVDDFTTAIDGSHVVTLSLTDTETKALEAGDYFYDVLIVDASGNDTTYLTGRVFVRDTITEKV